MVICCIDYNIVGIILQYRGRPISTFAIHELFVADVTSLYIYGHSIFVCLDVMPNLGVASI